MESRRRADWDDRMGVLALPHPCRRITGAGFPMAEVRQLRPISPRPWRLVDEARKRTRTAQYPSKDGLQESPEPSSARGSQPSGERSRPRGRDALPSLQRPYNISRLTELLP